MAETVPITAAGGGIVDLQVALAGARAGNLPERGEASCMYGVAGRGISST